MTTATTTTSSVELQIPIADLKYRMRMLETENNRLMSDHGQLIVETNRRIEVGDYIKLILVYCYRCI